jgi:hypothetical protein
MVPVRPDPRQDDTPYHDTHAILVVPDSKFIQPSRHHIILRDYSSHERFYSAKRKLPICHPPPRSPSLGFLMVIARGLVPTRLGFFNFIEHFFSHGTKLLHRTITFSLLGHLKKQHSCSSAIRSVRIASGVFAHYVPEIQVGSYPADTR